MIKKFKNRIPLLVWLLLPLCALHAQDGVIPVDAVGRLTVEEEYQQHAEQRKKALQKKMDLRVNYITGVCNLSDAQKKKLQIASKGAVSKNITQWKEHAIKRVQNLNNQVAPANVNNYALTPRQVDVESEPFWKKTLDNILTTEQKLKYQKALDERVAFHLRAAVYNSLARIDEQLLLNTKQRDALFKLLSESAESIQVQDTDNRSLRAMLDRSVTQAIPKIPQETLQKTFTEVQLAKWSEFKSRQVRTYGYYYAAPQAEAIQIKAKKAEGVLVKPK